MGRDIDDARHPDRDRLLGAAGSETLAAAQTAVASCPVMPVCLAFVAALAQRQPGECAAGYPQRP
jgi:hypothetical protein